MRRNDNRPKQVSLQEFSFTLPDGSKLNPVELTSANQLRNLQFFIWLNKIAESIPLFDQKDYEQYKAHQSGLDELFNLPDKVLVIGDHGYVFNPDVNYERLARKLQKQLGSNRDLLELINGSKRYKNKLDILLATYDSGPDEVFEIYQHVTPNKIHATLPDGRQFDPLMIENTDQLQNIICFEYLRNIVRVLPEAKQDEVSDILGETASIDFLYALKRIIDKQGKHGEIYDPEQAYGDVYEKVLTLLEKHITSIERLNESDAYDGKYKGQFSPVINAIFFNFNHGLELSATAIANARSKKKVEDLFDVEDLHHVEEKISKKLSPGIGNSVNDTTPTSKGGLVGRLFDNIRPDYKPQFGTSIVSVRGYKHTGKLPFIELRMGTMAQLVNYRARVSPLFNAFLKLQKSSVKREADKPCKITHVYFQNLGKDRGKGNREVPMTLTLEELNNPNSNVAVITLPADKYQMSKKKITDHEIVGAKDVIFEEFFAEATQNGKDFFIADNVKELLYGVTEDEFPLFQGQNYDREKESQIIRQLLKNSFDKFGFTENVLLTAAQKQAVYFHFIKYELTNFIIEKLEPQTVNFSCKDGIDRGGVSSAYYNLMKSLEMGECMSKVEFDRALHAAPTLVKGRGMNHHSKLIWNAIDGYLTGLVINNKGVPGAFNENNAPKWLLEWHNKRAPKGSYVYHMNQIIKLEDKCLSKVDAARFEDVEFGEEGDMYKHALLVTQSLKNEMNQQRFVGTIAPVDMRCAPAKSVLDIPVVKDLVGAIMKIKLVGADFLKKLFSDKANKPGGNRY